MTGSVTLFDEEFIHKLEYLKIVSSRLLPGHLKGEHRARKAGSGVEFADYRAYVWGDDTRHLDWRTYLRLDKLLLRLYEEEADLPVYIFLDASGSMDQGEPSKFDYARKVAAALCYIGLLNLDRVSLIAFAGDIVDEMSSTRGRNQIWRAFQFLESLRPGGPTAVEKALRSFFGTTRRRGLAVILSDFLDPAGIDRAFNLLRYFRHDVFALQLLSLGEVCPELPDEVMLVDAEDGTKVRLHVTPGLLQAYREKLEQHARTIEASCVQHGWSYLKTTTDIPFEDLILRVFRQDRFLR